MLTFEDSFWSLVLQVNVPLVLSLGQYRHEVGRLQGRASTNLLSSCLVLVDARTRWSERFLLRLRPNTISDSNSGLDVLVLPRMSQLEDIISLIDGLAGLWVVTQ